MLACLKFTIPPCKKEVYDSFYTGRKGFVTYYVYKVCPDVISFYPEEKDDGSTDINAIISVPIYYNQLISFKTIEDRIKTFIHSVGLLQWQTKEYSGEYYSGDFEIFIPTTREERIASYQSFDIPEEFKQSLIKGEK